MLADDYSQDEVMDWKEHAHCKGRQPCQFLTISTNRVRGLRAPIWGSRPYQNLSTYRLISAQRGLMTGNHIRLIDFTLQPCEIQN